MMVRTLNQQDKSICDKEYYQVIEDITLVDMDGDKGLIFDPVKFAQVMGGLFNECGE